MPITDVNETMSKLAGRSRTQLIGSSFPDYFLERELAAEGVRLTFKEGSVTNYVLTLQAGADKQIPVSFNAAVFRDPLGNIRGIFASARDITAQKRLEVQLQASQFYTRSLIESNIDALMTTDSLGIITDVNQQMESLTGCTREELIGKAFKDHFTDPARAEEGIRQVLQQGKVTNYELTARSKTGREMVVSYNATTFNDQAGRLQGVFAAARDITEQKKLEQQLREQQSYNRGLIESSVDGLITVDPVGTISDVNEQMCRMTGYGRTELIGSPFADYFTEPERAAAGVKQTFETGVVTEYALTLISHTRRLLQVSFNASVFRDPLGSVRGIFASARDVTDRVRLEEKLREQQNYLRGLIESSVDGLVHGFLGVPVPTGTRNYGMIYVADKLSGTEFGAEDVRFLTTIAAKLAVAYENALRYQEIQERTAKLEYEVAQRKQAEDRFRLLIETAPTGVLICDEKGRITEANAQLQRMFGYTQEELVGQAVEMLVPEQHRGVHVGHRGAYVNKPQTRPMGVGMELRGRRKDATTFPLEISLGPLVTGEGTWISSTVVDISERKKLEQQLQVSQRLESVGQLAAGIAHDFNNILTAITGNAKLALADLPVDHPVQRNLAEIQKGSLRATQLVRQILTFGRQDAPKREVIKLTPVVEEALKLLRAGLRAGIEIRTHFDSELPDVFADSTQVHQIVMNLATNAADAMAKKSVGVLEIRSEPVIVDADLAHTTPELREGSYVRLSIRDNGCGMDKATTARIFEPFYTTKPLGEGTGLGLSVVHGIMKTHCGAVTVYSEPGKGTVFQLYLPAAQEAAQEARTQKTQGEIRGHGERVLYVDDEEPLVFLMTRMLTQLGYQVTGCTEPQKALETFRSGPHDFDVVVSDLSMPQMSGIDLAREILQTRPGMPILIASGYIRPEDNEGVRSLGLPDLLLKPDTIDELSQSLHNIFAKSKSSTDGEQTGTDSRIRHRAASST
ncbi:MAG: hypothetical protein DMG80_00275 [Acidobacteria bacterium]|nr:MAG: hypothetical protein DMG80_00275 [Acidobacteriota bacterium]